MNIVKEDIQSPADFTERFINQTNQSIFLTGKAGTGKTTLLKKIISSTHKNTVVVAPTGIAALNAGGVTIHSFFQLPFGIFIPEHGQPPFLNSRTEINTKDTVLKHFRSRKQQQEIYRKLELLIVDEVSMLRADLLDAIDFKLRRIRRNDTPFGGVQVLFIGDLLQLPPIVRHDEKPILDRYYNGSFFFHSKVVQEQPPLYIELEKIYRQSDSTFIELLNNLRNNFVSEENMSLLNSYVQPNFDSTKNEGYITLTTHNHKADSINEKALASLTSKAYKFHSKVTGVFPENIYPIADVLELKLGAQVMFIKNDLSFEKRYYNGKIGIVSELTSDMISVTFPEEKKTIHVELYEWENKKFELNESNGEIEEEIVGTFSHFPLKLAWAITVHKSQGLTFEKAVLDLSDVFASGQAYVALSRLVSLKGLILTSPIHLNGLKNEADVVNYAQNKANAELLENRLESETVYYLLHKLQRTFNWEELVSSWLSVEAEHRNSGPRSEMGKHKPLFERQVNTLIQTLEPARKFRVQLSKICNPQHMKLDFLKERFDAAYGYFMDSLEPVLRENIKQILLLQDKTGVKQYIETLQELDEKITDVITDLKKAKNLVENLSEGKDLDKESIWDTQVRNFKIAKIQLIKEEIRKENPELTDFLEYEFIKEKEKKQRSPRKPRGEAKPKRVVGETYTITFNMHKEGKTIEEIAKERDMTANTISGHMGKLISENKVKLEDVISADRVEFLKKEFDKDPGATTSDIKSRLGDKVSWEELRLYGTAMRR